MIPTVDLPELDVFQPALMGTAVQMAADASAEHAGWKVFYQLLRRGELPPRLCTDAYLAALAITNGWRLVSFDRVFERFAGLERLALP